MEEKGKRLKVIGFFLFTLLLSTYLPAVPPCTADDHKGSKKYYQRHDDRKGDDLTGGLFGHGHDEGNETTGQIVAWSLAAVNLTVALSLLIRGMKRFVPLGTGARNYLTKFNSSQKRYLMRFHYLLNPFILLLAVAHWSLSRCSSTALPEWGLVTMGAIVASGIIVKFKLCPKISLRNIYKLHTHPVLPLLLILLLVIGHFSID